MPTSLPTITIVNAPGDSPNSGRTKWNTDLTNIIAWIAEHIESDDHDTQYYTKAQVEGFLDDLNAALAALQSDLSTATDEAVKVTGDQSIGGVKTLTSSPVISTSATASALLLEAIASGVKGQMKVEVRKYSTYTALVLMINAGTVDIPDWKDILFVKSNDLISRFVGDVYAGGFKLATEGYVQSRVRSGTIWKDFNCFLNISGGVSVSKDWLNAGDAPQTFIVSKNCMLVRASLGIISDDGSSAGIMDFTNINLAFNISGDGARVIFPCLNLTYGNGEYFPKLQIKAFDLNGQNSVIWESGEQQDYSFAAGDWNLCLTLEFQV